MTMQGGKRVLLDDLETTSRSRSRRYPFSFTYDNRRSDEMLSLWKSERSSEAVEEGRRRVTTTWSDATTGLIVRWEATCFPEASAVDWVLYFENAGATDTPGYAASRPRRRLPLAAPGPVVERALAALGRGPAVVPGGVGRPIAHRGSMGGSPGPSARFRPPSRPERGEG